MNRGYYIVFEGVVGTGKSTQSKQLQAYLANRFPDRQVIWTREPGGSEIAEAIRTVVQGTPFTETMNPICEAYLYAAARAQSLRTVVAPILEAGGIVVADRSFLTSVAWQGFGRELGFDTIWKINQAAIGDFLPDTVFYLDLDPTLSLARTFDAGGDKFETLPPAFFTRCREGYEFLNHHSDFASRWRQIDASGSREEVFARILTSGIIDRLS